MESQTAKKCRAKPKVVKDWAEEEVFKLIGLVEMERCIWDAGDSGYHNKTLRDNAWRNISDQFNLKFEPGDLNAKWTNLRIQYRGYAGRVKCKSGQGAVEAPKWRYFNCMSFVGRAEDQQTQQTISNIIDSDSGSSDLDESTTPQSAKKRQKKSVHQKSSSNSSAANQIAETMRETLDEIKQRKHNTNATFASYICSELETLGEASAIVRSKVLVFFLQCIEEERAKELPYFEVYH